MRTLMRTLRIFVPCAFMMVALVAASAYGQSFSVLYNLGTKSGDPLQPTFEGIVAQGRDGNLYTTSPSGGSHGTAFKITPTGTLTVIHDFNGVSDGGTPYSGLTLGTDGNFYGTTSTGGTGSFGTIFKMTPAGTLTVIYNFLGGIDGAFPLAPPIQGTDGNFYGTTAGNAGANHDGTVYKITPTGKFKTLHSFALTDGAFPDAPLVLGADGNFYGTTINGGSAGNFGTIFKITPAGKLTVLFNFDGTHGVFPVAPLVQGSDGDFYGTTFSGGVSNVGTVFKMTPSGTVTVLHNYNFSPDGGHPNAGLVEGTDGNFYGAAGFGGTLGFGTLYQITTGGIYTVLHTFDSTTGQYPNVTMMQHTNGNFYADALKGGSGANGVFYGLGDNLSAFISLVSREAKVGTTIGILGQGFKGTTAISFNGTPAITFKAVTNTYLTVKVPTGATTGAVSVTTPGGTLISNKNFIVLP